MEIGWGTSSPEKPRERQVFIPCACGGASRQASVRLGPPRSFRVRVEGPLQALSHFYASMFIPCACGGAWSCTKLIEASWSTPCACGRAASPERFRRLPMVHSVCVWKGHSRPSRTSTPPGVNSVCVWKGRSRSTGITTKARSLRVRVERP
jgi:hypothetical protein